MQKQLRASLALLRLVLLFVPMAALSIVLVLLGLVVVWVGLKRGWDMKTLPIWGNSDGIEGWYKGTEYHWYAIRNPANNFRRLFTRPDEFETIGDEDLEAKDGFQWNFRYSKWMEALRVTFGKRNKSKGKKEVYIGWKLGNQKIEGISWTFQSRPVWVALSIIGAIVALIVKGI